MAAAKKKTPAKKPAAKKRAPRRTTQEFVRNLRAIPVSFRLQESERRIELAPRGQRGDLRPIKKVEKEDPIFVANKELVFEVISKEEADIVQEKQHTNAQPAKRHPSLDIIRNERGEEYEDDPVRLADEEEATGKAVAPLDEEGNLIIDRDVGIRRANVPGTVGNDPPKIPDSVAPEDQAAYLAEQRQSE